MKNIITIARQFGSNGQDIGKLAAQKAGVPFYDKALIRLAAKKSGVSEEVFERVDERPTNSLLYALSMGGGYGVTASGYTPKDMPLNDQLFFLQCDIIRQAAQEGPCVIVGRCADYVLREMPNVCKVFLYADPEFRTAQVQKDLGLSEKKAMERMVKADKQRASFYNYYSNQRWGRVENYDLALNTAKLSIEQAADILLAFEAAFKG